MSITIDNNTLVQLLVRRGTDAARKTVVLSQGEIGYTTDTQRLFIGDGQTNGGNSVASKFLSNVLPISSTALSAQAQIGDFTYDPFLNNIYLLTAGGFQLAGPTILYGTGFNYSNASYTFNLDSNYWSASGGSIIIGSLSSTQVPGNIITGSNLNVNGVLSLNGPTTRRLVLSAGTTQISISTNCINQYNAVNVGDFGLVIHGSTYIDGTLSAYAGNFSNVSTAVTTASTLSSCTLVYNPVPNLIVQSYNRSSSPTSPIVNIQYSQTSSNTVPAFVITAQPFVGVGMDGTVFNTAFSGVSSTCSFGVSSVNSIFSGNVYVNGDVISNFAASDITLKQNIQTIPSALSKITQLDGVTFDWKDNFIHSGKSVGLLAQQVEKILPEAVQTRSDGYKGVDYNKVIPIIVEAIKELNKKIS